MYINGLQAYAHENENCSKKIKKLKIVEIFLFSIRKCQRSSKIIINLTRKLFLHVVLIFIKINIQKLCYTSNAEEVWRDFTTA